MTAPDPFEVAGKIRGNLRLIREHYETALDPGRVTDDSDPRSGTNSGEPINLHTLETRANTIRCLVYWTRFLTDELEDGPTHGPRGITVDDLGAFIDTWALQLAENMPDDADNLRRETARHGNALEALARGWRSKRIRIPGRCPELNFVVSAQGLEELVPCEGEIHAVFREEDNGMLPRTIRCDQDAAHEWAPHDWAGLGKRIGTFQDTA